MTEYSAFQKLQDIYKLLNMQEIEYLLEQDGDDWIAELISDGKIIDNNQIGFGSTQEEALNDAAERFLSFTPVLDNVPTSKILELMESSRRRY